VNSASMNAHDLKVETISAICVKNIENLIK
jgi:hypothetical protein